MRRIVIGVGLLASLLLGVGLGEFVVSQELPPEMRADQYLMAGQRALEHDDPATAIEAFQKLDALPGDPPVEFSFWYGRALVEQGISQSDVGMVTNGEGFLKQYLLETGRESEHYTSALEWISRVEGKRLPWLQLPANEVGPSTGQPAIPEISPHVVKIAKQTKLDQCDNNLWGVWQCSHHADGDYFYLSNAIGEDGIEVVTLEMKPKTIFNIGGFKHSYRVDRKWHTGVRGHQGETRVSCRGWNDLGFREFSILERKSKGIFPADYQDFFVDAAGVLWWDKGKIYRRKDGEIQEEEKYSNYCERVKN